MRTISPNLQRVLFSGITAFILYSCITPMENFAEYTRAHTVITGQISTLPDRNFVTIGRTATKERLPDPVSGATVELHDDEGNVYVYFESAKAGTYHLPGYAGRPLTEYHLEVILPLGGTRYVSAPEVLPAQVAEFSASYEIEPREELDREGTPSKFFYTDIYVSSTFSDAESPAYLKWNVEEVYMIKQTDFPDPFGVTPPDCFVTQNADPQTIVLLNRREIRTNEVSRQLVASRRIDQSFHYKHAFTVYQSAITREAHEYWRKVDIVANQNGSIFDQPPAEITGNFSNPARAEERIYGYFQATNQLYQRFFLIKHDVPVFLPDYCDYLPFRVYETYPRECLDCTVARNVGFIRPDWF